MEPVEPRSQRDSNWQPLDDLMGRSLELHVSASEGFANVPQRQQQLSRVAATVGNANVATMLRIRAEQAWARIGQVPYCSHEPRAAADEEAAGRQ